MSIERSDGVRSEVAWRTDEAIDDDRAEVPESDGLVTLRYLWDAVRRHVRLWVVTAVLGLAVGFAVPFVMPPATVASTKLLLTHEPGSDAQTAMETDVSLAATESVASRVIDQLNLDESPNDLLSQYTVSSSTDRVMQISVSAPTGEQAVRLARTVASTYLDFRMEQVQARQGPVEARLAQARDRLETLEKNAARSKKPDSNGIDGSGGSEDNGPGSALSQANDQVTQLQQELNSEKADAALMSSSHVLDPAAVVPKSALKALVLDAMTGIGAGLVLGVGFVVVRAMLSDRVWRRQVIADALGARLMLSLPPVRHPRWWCALTPIVPPTAGPDELAFAVRHLHGLTEQQVTIRKTLAVVANEDVTPAAIIVARLAELLAAEGNSVLVVDLTGQSAIARELQPTELVSVHEPDGDGPPLGWLHRDDPTATDEEAVQVSWDVADVVLTLTTVSAGLGADHLATWAAHALVVVTAGRSSATRIRTTAELIRLCGMQLHGGILVGSDHNDETAGMPSDVATSAPVPAQDRPPHAIEAGRWRG